MSEYWKEQIIKKLLFSAFILLLAGVVLLILDYPNIKMHLFGPVEFESLEPDEIDIGLIVDASIDINFGAYACEEKQSYYYGYSITSEPTDVYYVIRTGDVYAEDYKFMGIKVPATEQSVMEEIAEAASDGKHVEPAKYTAVITSMTSEEYPLFEAYFREAGWTEEEIEERTLPYTINVSYTEKQDHSDLYLVMAVFLVPVIIAVWCREWKS